MNLSYKTTTTHPNKLRTLHIIIIEEEVMTTTIAKEVFQFAKNRNIDKRSWKELKEAVSLGRPLTISGGSQ